MKNSWQPWEKARKSAGFVKSPVTCHTSAGMPKVKEEESMVRQCHPAKEETGDRRRRKAEKKEPKEVKARKAAKARTEAKEEEKEELKAKDRHWAASRAEDRTGKLSARKEAERE